MLHRCGAGRAGLYLTEQPTSIAQAARPAATMPTHVAPGCTAVRNPPAPALARPGPLGVRARPADGAGRLPGIEDAVGGAIAEVLTGAGTADQTVPDEKQAAVLHAFGATIPGLTLPFGLKPTSEGARGSDVIIEGITSGVTVALPAFRQS